MLGRIGRLGRVGRFSLLSSTAFSPLMLFAASEPGIWLDPSDVANLTWRRNFATGSAAVGNAAYWPSSLLMNGVTATKVASGFDTDGLPYVDVRYQGTASGTSHDAAYNGTVNGRTAATSGQQFSASLIASVIAGSTANVNGLRSSVVEETAPSTYIGQAYSSPTTTGTPATLTANLTVATGNQVRAVVHLSFTNGATIDVTYRIKALQFELGSTRTAYQPITDLNTEVIQRFPNATLYQDTAGTTPVTTPGQTVALALDKSRALALGAELVTNGDFSSGLTGWSFTGAAPLPTVVGGAATFVGGAASNRFIGQAGKLVVGRTYLVSATVTVSAGMIGPDMTGYAANVSVSGTYTWRLQASITTLSFIATNNFVGTIDNISVRELAGNHATQTTAASRPTYGVMPSVGVRNRANGSADVGNTFYWPATFTTNGITATKVASGFDTDGLPYVDVRYQGTATSSFNDGAFNNGLSRSFAATGQQYTASCYVLRIAGSMTGVFGVRAAMIEETAPSTYLAQSANPPLNGNTETLSVGTLTITTGNQVRGLPTFECNNGSTVDVTFRIKGLQIELGPTRTNYQFNYSQFNVVEAPFASLGYLAFDGVDDFMVTPTITPNTDKAQVFAGVRKLSDADGLIAEMSPSVDVANGSVGLYANAPGGPSVYQFRSRGTTLISVNHTTPAPDTVVLSGLGDISAPSARLRRNGVQVAQSTGSQGTSNYTAYQMWIGRRNGAQMPLNGNLFQLIIRFGANLDAATIASTERFVGGKTGVTIA